MKELFSVTVDEDDNVIIRSVLPKEDLKGLLTDILESIEKDKAFEVEINDNDKPKYLA